MFVNFSGSNRDVEETVIAIISQLIIQLHDCNDDDIAQRLLKKMTDNNGEKLDRCAELCVKYAKILLTSEKQIESTAEALKVHLIIFSNARHSFFSVDVFHFCWIILFLSMMHFLNVKKCTHLC